MGDATVPWSPLELAVAFVEVVGIHPHECWGIAERNLATEHRDAFAQVVFRPRPEHDDGMGRFAAHLASLGLVLPDVDLGHPEGTIGFQRGGVTRMRS